MTAEKFLIDQRERFVAAVRERWRGYERELLISVVRALDVAAYDHVLGVDGGEGPSSIRLRGAATALRPLLEAVRGMPGPMPWFPSNPDLSPAFDKYLLDCGYFAVAIRLAALERYGIAKTTRVNTDKILIDVLPEGRERADLEAMHAANDRAVQRARARLPQLDADGPEVVRRMTRYGRVDQGWFIGYDSDQFLLDHYRARAEVEAAGVVEAAALPPSGLIGGRPFSDWSTASTHACGTVLHHFDAATLLRSRHSELDIRDLLTIYARRDDFAEVLVERGNSVDGASQLMAGLMLNAEGAASSEIRHEIPLAYYIDAGEHFVLLPLFGALMNSHAGLLDYLRRTYRSDWDKIVEGREAVFRADLRSLLPDPRYNVPKKGLKLRRKDNSLLTDVDAVVLDRSSGRLVFVQLKWHDAYGFGLAERASRQENLLKYGNEWVDKVHSWIAGRTSQEISATYGWGDANEGAPQILVMARHSSQFAGETRYDPRANWISWNSLTEEMHASDCDGFGSAISRAQSRPPQRPDSAGASIIRLPGITVEVRTRTTLI